MGAMIHLVRAGDGAWDRWLAGAPHDFAHTGEYGGLSERHFGGEAWLAVYEENGRHVAWPYVLRNLDGVADATCVYGWGGPVACGGEAGDPLFARAWEAIAGCWRSQKIVSVFARFHPLIENQKWLAGAAGGGFRFPGSAVAIDLRLPAEETWKQYKRQLRQHLKRGLECGLVTEPDPEWRHLDDFLRLYYATMERNRAAGFYFFTKQYLLDLKTALGRHAVLMVSRMGEAVAAAGLLIEYGDTAHVFLTAWDEAMVHASPCKVLIHESGRWAREQGKRYLLLGGGRGNRDDDPLFRFKSEFSPWHRPVCLGCWILDAERYERLAGERAREAAARNARIDAAYFPAYRAPLIEGEICETTAR